MNPNVPTTTEAGAIAALALKTLQPVVDPKVEGLEHPIVVLPDGRVVTLKEHMRATRKKADVVLHDHTSFINYVLDHQEPLRTAVFAQLTETVAEFVAILDYHERNEHDPVDGDGSLPRIGKPQYGDHRCRLILQHTPEWKRWKEQSGKPVGQVEMANFLEDNRVDIIEPDAASVVEIAKTFEATQGMQFRSAARLQNGDRALHYDVTTGAKAGQKGDLQIPEKIRLRLPIFLNGPAYDVEAWFRYRITDGQLRLAVELVRPHKVVELALRNTSQGIASAIKLPIHQGEVVSIGRE